MTPQSRPLESEVSESNGLDRYAPLPDGHASGNDGAVSGEADSVAPPQGAAAFHGDLLS